MGHQAALPPRGRKSVMLVYHGQLFCSLLPHWCMENRFPGTSKGSVRAPGGVSYPCPLGWGLAGLRACQVSPVASPKARKWLLAGQQGLPGPGRPWLLWAWPACPGPAGPRLNEALCGQQRLRSGMQPSPREEQCGLYPSLASASSLGGGSREGGRAPGDRPLSSLMMGLFWLTHPWEPGPYGVPP